MTDSDWQWLTVTDSDWQWLTVADSGWQWLTMAYSDCQWMTVTDCEWRWLMVTVGDWWLLTVTYHHWWLVSVTDDDLPWSTREWRSDQKFIVRTREGQLRAVKLQGGHWGSEDYRLPFLAPQSGAHIIAPHRDPIPYPDPSRPLIAPEHFCPDIWWIENHLTITTV